MTILKLIVALSISMAFERVWHAGLLHKLKSYRLSGQIFCLISFFLSNRQLWVVLDGKSLQEFSVNAGVLQGSILAPTFFLLYINDLPDNICDITIYADDTTLYNKCDQASDLWKHLNWLLNLNPICKILWTGAKSGLLISMLGKLNWFCLTSLVTLVLLMWKWMGLFLKKNHLLRCWGWPFNWIGVLHYLYCSYYIH